MAFVYYGSDRGAGLAHWCWEHSWQGISSKQSQTNEAASTGTWLNKLNLIESSILTMTEKEVTYDFPNEFLYNHLLFKTCYSRRAATLQDTFNCVFEGSLTGSGTPEVFCIRPASMATGQWGFKASASKWGRCSLPLDLPWLLSGYLGRVWTQETLNVPRRAKIDLK